MHNDDFGLGPTGPPAPVSEPGPDLSRTRILGPGPGSLSCLDRTWGPGSGSRLRPEGAEPEPDRTSASLHDSSQHRGFLEAMEDQDLLRPWSVLYYCSVLGKQRP